MNPLRERTWSPYAAGAGIGALSWLAFATAKRPLGITSTFENTAALVGQAVAPRAMRGYLQARAEPPAIDWQSALVLGVLLGSYVSSGLSNDRRHPAVPFLWKRRFGGSRLRRYAGAFLGGALMMFGARMAKGCTSGHGISGALQFALSSWVFNPLMLASGAAAARALFGKERA